jgi:hypothetical protein
LCAAASFTANIDMQFNCFFFKNGSFQVNENRQMIEMWTSWTRAAPPVMATTTTKKLATQKIAEKYLLENTQLVGAVYEKQTVASEDDCFDICDETARCAAVSYNLLISQCNMHKFGFVRPLGFNDSWISYIKPEVAVDIEDMHKLNETFHTVLLNTRYVNWYDSLDTLTPWLCFVRCKESLKCRAASFYANVLQPLNCYLFQKGEARDDGKGNEFWTSYLKLADMARPVAGSVLSKFSKYVINIKPVHV